MTSHDYVDSLTRLKALAFDQWRDESLVWKDVGYFCKQIDVGGRIPATYAFGRKHVRGSENVSEADFAQFVDAWLGLVDRVVADASSDLGRRLKIINSGLKLVDLWEAEGCAQQEEISVARAELLNLLDRIMA